MNQAQMKGLLTGNKARWIAAACAVLAVGSAAAQPYGYPNDPGPVERSGPPRIVHCESNNWGSSFCPIPIPPMERVQVARQLSQQPCIRGRTWNAGERGIWVHNGCRADFAIVARGPQRPPVAYLGSDDGRYAGRDGQWNNPGDRNGPPPGSYDRYAPQGSGGSRPSGGAGGNGGGSYDSNDQGSVAAFQYGQNANGPQNPNARKGTVTVRDADDQGTPDQGPDGSNQPNDPNSQHQ